MYFDQCVKIIPNKIFKIINCFVYKIKINVIKVTKNYNI